MGKKAAGPAAITIAVVVLAAIIFVIYHFTLGQSGPKPNPATIPAYIKAGMTPAERAKLGITETTPTAKNGGAPASRTAGATPGH
ncbi:MAG TPA: hypothetical protein VFJ58_08335 [Armatimonadota bacterium]|nr:hypothetical protein [Armatimonadota bacterium]